MVFIIAARVITLWMISLWRLLSYQSSCFPSDPPFLPTGDINFISIPFLASFFYALTIVTGPSNPRSNVLLVIAHPDDESMFFVPTILFLNSQGHSVHILCMSNGNAEGIGNKRKEELYRACVVLKVPLQQVKVVDHPNLQDGFNKPWDHLLLTRLVEDAIKTWNIDAHAFTWRLIQRL